MMSVREAFMVAMAMPRALTLWEATVALAWTDLVETDFTVTVSRTDFRVI